MGLKLTGRSRSVKITRQFSYTTQIIALCIGSDLTGTGGSHGDDGDPWSRPGGDVGAF